MNRGVVLNDFGIPCKIWSPNFPSINTIHPDIESRVMWRLVCKHLHDITIPQELLEMVDRYFWIYQKPCNRCGLNIITSDNIIPSYYECSACLRYEQEK